MLNGSELKGEMPVIGGSESVGTVVEPQGAAADIPATRGFAPADKVVIAYFLLTSLLVVTSLRSVNRWWLLLSLHGAVIAIVAAMARWPIDSGIAGFVRGWYAILLVPLSYKELEYLVPRINPVDVDRQLAAIDFRVLGVHPTVWLERITHPALTEFFQIAYITYYFFPLAVGIPLWRKRRIGEFHTVLFSLLLAFYLSYLGYLAVPAVGPRFILNSEQTIQLQGLLCFQAIRSALDWVEGLTRDCFPSGHTAIALVVLYYAARFNRPVFWRLLPAGVALILSTVYLRYHYVVDVAAGMALALLVVLVAKPFYRALGGRAEEGVKQFVEMD